MQLKMSVESVKVMVPSVKLPNTPSKALLDKVPINFFLFLIFYYNISFVGYVKVAEIFRGSRNVLIEELKPSANTIAITGPDEKHYYLNGDL